MVRMVFQNVDCNEKLSFNQPYPTQTPRPKAKVRPSATPAQERALRSTMPPLPASSTRSSRHKRRKIGKQERWKVRNHIAHYQRFERTLSEICSHDANSQLVAWGLKWISGDAEEWNDDVVPPKPWRLDNPRKFGGGCPTNDPDWEDWIETLALSSSTWGMAMEVDRLMPHL